ncbi:MAG: SDR family NAD(P)-dependent oxidoreductase [Hyphomicrobiales bacterium]
MIDLQGRTVVITGAGRGLGAAFAVVMADLGAHVVMAGRNPETLGAMAESIRLRTGRRPETAVFDLADAGEVTRWAKARRDEGGKIDVLVNNAAQWLPGAMDSHDAHAIASTIASTVTGTLLLTRGLLPLLEASGGGDVVNIVSISGLPNVALHGASVAFVAAKHGQAGLTDALRQELAPRHVRVIGVYPPTLDDISPLEAQWNEPRFPGSRANNRDVVDTVLFALSRPRHLTVSTVVLEGATGGLHPTS